MSTTYAATDARAIYPFNSTKGLDHKAWAKRIMYREQKGDNSLLSVQVKFAQIALDLVEMPKK